MRCGQRRGRCSNYRRGPGWGKVKRIAKGPGINMGINNLQKTKKQTEIKLKKTDKLFINKDLCRFCGLCMDACKFNAIRLNDGNFEIIQEQCRLCRKCLQDCPAEAIEIITE